MDINFIIELPFALQTNLSKNQVIDTDHFQRNRGQHYAKYRAENTLYCGRVKFE